MKIYEKVKRLKWIVSFKEQHIPPFLEWVEIHELQHANFAEIRLSKYKDSFKNQLNTFRISLYGEYTLNAVTKLTLPNTFYRHPHNPHIYMTEDLESAILFIENLKEKFVRHYEL